MQLGLMRLDNKCRPMWCKGFSSGWQQLQWRIFKWTIVIIGITSIQVKRTRIDQILYSPECHWIRIDLKYAFIISTKYMVRYYWQVPNALLVNMQFCQSTCCLFTCWLNAIKAIHHQPYTKYVKRPSKIK